MLFLSEKNVRRLIIGVDEEGGQLPLPLFPRQSSSDIAIGKKIALFGMLPQKRIPALRVLLFVGNEGHQLLADRGGVIMSQDIGAVLGAGCVCMSKLGIDT